MDQNTAAREGGAAQPETAGADSSIRREVFQRLERSMQRRVADERDRTILARARLAADAQVREISALDGAVQSLDDLMDMPEYDAFYGLVKKGVSLVEAYKLTHYDSLVKRAAEAAARQAARSVGSRGHLTAVAGQPGAGEYVSVPAEIAAGYRLAKPGISDEEIRRKYRKFQKYHRQ